MKKLHSILIIGAVTWIALFNGVRIPPALIVVGSAYILIRGLWAFAMFYVRSQARREELKKKRG